MTTYADDGKSAPDACNACALSVLRRLEDVPIARKAMPWFKKRLVAGAQLSSVHGVIKQTGPHASHFSLWADAGHAPTFHTLFAVVR